MGGLNKMDDIIILMLILFILATIGGWINRHSRAANRIYRMLERFIAKTTESIAWAIIGGK